MSAPRRISLSTHGVVELTAGLALVGASLLLDLGTAGVIATFLAGVILVSTGLGAAESMPLVVHQSLDRWLVVALAAAAVAVSSGGAALAAGLLLGAAVLELALAAATRWARPTRTI